MKAFFEKKVYPWEVSEGICFCGYFFYEGVLYKGIDAIDCVRKQCKDGITEDFLSVLDGVFSIIEERGNRILFCVDRLRGLPLFYTVSDGELIIGDDAFAVRSKMSNVTLSKEALIEYKSTDLFVSGRDTLFRDLFQVRAGELCVFRKEDGNVEGKLYFQVRHGNFYEDNQIEIIKEAFRDAYKKTGENLVKVLNGRTAVVPLSGGADSRMIISMLKEEGYEKVICYTYGREGNRESQISKSVADSYGYKWIMVPYTGTTWKKLRTDSDMIECLKKSFSYCAISNIQDFPAVKYLHEKELIPADSVFVPGHSGDIPNGNHIAKVYTQEEVTREECINNIITTNYHVRSDAAVKRMLKEYPIPDSGTVQDYATWAERVDVAERQAKWIVNSVRIYEHFGYEWLIPLWDKNQFDFWEKISIFWRYKRKLYYYITADKLPSTNDVTAKTRFAETIRNIPVVKNVARRINRTMRWWKSPLCIEHRIPMPEYFWACLTERSTFGDATIENRQIIRYMENKYEKR